MQETRREREKKLQNGLGLLGRARGSEGQVRGIFLGHLGAMAAGNFMVKSKFGRHNEGGYDFFVMRTAPRDQLDGARPRYLSIGWMLGSPPSQAAYIRSRTSVLPRERIIRRKRSPLARVKPP